MNAFKRKHCGSPDCRKAVSVQTTADDMDIDTHVLDQDTWRGLTIAAADLARDSLACGASPRRMEKLGLVGERGSAPPCTR
jgi:hypothetical protein